MVHLASKYKFSRPKGMAHDRKKRVFTINFQWIGSMCDVQCGLAEWSRPFVPALLQFRRYRLLGLGRQAWTSLAVMAIVNPTTATTLSTVPLCFTHSTAILANERGASESLPTPTGRTRTSSVFGDSNVRRGVYVVCGVRTRGCPVSQLIYYSNRWRTE